jgi:lipoprotein-anchoring transpeptidase ErfK/SrfK
MDRRSFLKGAVMAGVAAASAIASGAQSASAEHAPVDKLQARKGKWIEVILSEQRLVAWEDGRAVLTSSISSGTRRTPTVRGTFRIYRKYSRQRMRGPGYDLPNVPFVMYFKGAYALHGTYWHNNFGRPMSHGCVNLPTGKAGWLYEWAPRGTTVVVH